jgi:hypothetical protein
MRQIICCAVLALLAACSSPDPNFYTLQAVPGTPHPDIRVIVEVRRPGLAGYLDRSDIVLNHADYQLKLNSQQRWAEPLGDMIGRVLTQDLSQRLPKSSIYSESGAITSNPTVRLELDIERLDDTGGGHVVLDGQLALEVGMTHNPLRTHHLTLSTDASAGPAGLAAAFSTLIGQIADQAATDLAGGA